MTSSTSWWSSCTCLYKLTQWWHPASPFSFYFKFIIWSSSYCNIWYRSKNCWRRRPWLKFHRNVWGNYWLFKISETLDQSELYNLVRSLSQPFTRICETIGFLPSNENLLGKGTQITLYGSRDQEFRNFFFLMDHLFYASWKVWTFRLETFYWLFQSKFDMCSFAQQKQYATSILSQCKRRIWSTSESSLLIDTHKWIICVNLKLVKFRLGQQSGYTKFPCFLCLWDSIVGTGFPTPLFYESPYTTILLTI